MTKTVLMVPFHFTRQEHGEMLQHKIKLADKLKDDNVDIVGTVDRFAFPIIGIPPFAAWINLVTGGSHGIVAPTKTALTWAQKNHGDDVLFVRTGQDCFFDVDRFKLFLREWRQNISDNWIAGDIAWADNIFPFLEELGIQEEKRKIPYIQGNFMVAPLRVWMKYYMALPPSIVHYKDDSIMSHLCEIDGGKLIEIDPFWRHFNMPY